MFNLLMLLLFACVIFVTLQLAAIIVFKEQTRLKIDVCVFINVNDKGN